MLQREGAEQTEPIAWGSVRELRVGLCPVGRSLSRASSSLGLMPTCTDSAPPGLATFSRAAGPDEPGQSPTRLVSGYSHRLSVLPNAAIPPCPVRGPQPLGYRLFWFNHAPTYWIYRSGLPCGRQKAVINARSQNAQTERQQSFKGRAPRLRRPFLGRSMHPFKSTVDNCTGVLAGSVAIRGWESRGNAGDHPALPG